MPKVKCVHCGVNLERYEMPHHIRELHKFNDSSKPGQPNRNIPETSFGAWQARQSTQPASVITQPERERLQWEIQDIVHAFTALPDQLRQACSESVEILPVLGVSPSALQQSVGVVVYAAVRRCMRTPSRIFNYALQRN